MGGRMSGCGCAACNERKPTPPGMPPMRAGGVGPPFPRHATLRAGGDPMADLASWYNGSAAAIGNFVQKAGNAAGQAICQLVPDDVKRALTKSATDAKPLLSDPFFAWLIGPYPAMAAELARTCNFTEAFVQGSCVMARNARIATAVWSLAGTVGAAVGIGLPITVVAGVVLPFAAAVGPVATAFCQRRAPQVSDVVNMGAAMARTMTALGTNPTDIAGAMRIMTELSETAVASGIKDPTAAAGAAMSSLRADPAAFMRKAGVAPPPSTVAKEKAKAQMRAKASAAAAEVADARAMVDAAMTTTTTQTGEPKMASPLVPVAAGAGAGFLLGGPLGALLGAGAGFALSSSSELRAGAVSLSSSLDGLSTSFAKASNLASTASKIASTATPTSMISSMMASTSSSSSDSAKERAKQKMREAATAAAAEVAALRAAESGYVTTSLAKVPATNLTKSSVSTPVAVAGVGLSTGLILGLGGAGAVLYFATRSEKRK